MNKFDILPVNKRPKLVFISFSKTLAGVQSFFNDIITPILGSDTNEVSFWLDEQLELYNRFEMGRSFSNTWNLATIKAYAGFIKSGIVLPSYTQGEDVYQLGGDVLLENGFVKKVFVSKSPVDIVRVSELL